MELSIDFPKTTTLKELSNFIKEKLNVSIKVESFGDLQLEKIGQGGSGVAYKIGNKNLILKFTTSENELDLAEIVYNKGPFKTINKISKLIRNKSYGIYISDLLKNIGDLDEEAEIIEDYSRAKTQEKRKDLFNEAYENYGNKLANYLVDLKFDIKDIFGKFPWEIDGLDIHSENIGQDLKGNYKVFDLDF